VSTTLVDAWIAQRQAQGRKATTRQISKNTGSTDQTYRKNGLYDRSDQLIKTIADLFS
jgi:hypothetical protein